MREKLITYVELIFAGAPHSEDIKQEILQNTLDKYDDLVSQGKSEQAAYQLAISGIGDINELLSGNGQANEEPQPPENKKPTIGDFLAPWKKVIRAIGIFLYIICPIPLFVMSEFGMDTIGLCALLSIVAVATALMVISGTNNTAKKHESQAQPKESETSRAVGSLIGVLGLCIYLLVSFFTGAWYITWIIFPIMGAIKGLAKAIMDLKEASSHEN